MGGFINQESPFWGFNCIIWLEFVGAFVGLLLAWLTMDIPGLEWSGRVCWWPSIFYGISSFLLYRLRLFYTSEHLIISDQSEDSSSLVSGTASIPKSSFREKKAPCLAPKLLCVFVQIHGFRDFDPSARRAAAKLGLAQVNQGNPGNQNDGTSWNPNQRP